MDEVYHLLCRRKDSILLSVGLRPTQAARWYNIFQTDMFSSIRWYEVTWYSRLGAIVLCFGVVPALFFYIGVQSQIVRDSALNVVVPQDAEMNAAMGSNNSTEATFADSTIESVLSQCQNDPSNGTPGGPNCLGDALRSYKEIETQKFNALVTEFQSSVVSIAALGDDPAQYAQAIVSLKKSEASWAAYRDSLCESASKQYSDTWSIANAYDRCEISVTKKHVQDLLSAAPPVG